MQIAHPRFIHVRVKIGERGEKKKKEKGGRGEWPCHILRFILAISVLRQLRTGIYKY